MGNIRDKQYRRMEYFCPECKLKWAPTKGKEPKLSWVYSVRLMDQVVSSCPECKPNIPYVYTWQYCNNDDFTDYVMNIRKEAATIK